MWISQQSLSWQGQVFLSSNQSTWKIHNILIPFFFQNQPTLKTHNILIPFFFQHDRGRDWISEINCVQVSSGSARNEDSFELFQGSHHRRRSRVSSQLILTKLKGIFSKWLFLFIGILEHDNASEWGFAQISNGSNGKNKGGIFWLLEQNL